MAGEKWVIYWNEYSADTYLYGSEITYHKRDDVEYDNAMMPPGTVIKEWYSKPTIRVRELNRLCR